MSPYKSPNLVDLRNIMYLFIISQSMEVAETVWWKA